MHLGCGVSAVIGDAKSTGNLQKHMKRCWGDEIVASGDEAKTAKKLHATTVKGILDPQAI
jgi:hypothetical protein